MRQYTALRTNDVKIKIPQNALLEQFLVKSRYQITNIFLQWSFGVTMWEIFSGAAHPYPHVDNMDIHKYVNSGRRLDRPRGCPQEL